MRVHVRAVLVACEYMFGKLLLGSLHDLCSAKISRDVRFCEN
jgi:hypothetical protein